MGRVSGTALAEALGAIEALIGARLSRNPGIRERHGRGEGHLPGAAPDAVAFVQSTEEVAAIVRACARHRLPVIPFGVGTSLESHVAAVEGGVCIDLSGMADVLELNGEDLDVLVQAGITRKQLNAHLRDQGLFFPIDPGADATIGGMVGTRASGTNAVRYGTMRENVMGLTVVMADGRIVHTGGRARKSSAGYDLTRLLVGSEGTLGIVTEVRLRLYGLPERMSSAVCAFPSVDAAVRAVIETIQLGIPVARIELLDALQMRACIAFAKLEGMTPAPTLFLEFHGSEAAVAEQAQMVGGIAGEHGGTGFRWTQAEEERAKLWQARHDAYYAALALKPGARGWPTDVCVPISRLAECIEETVADLERTGVIAPIVGHVGDGNFHLVMVVDPDDPGDVARSIAVNEALTARAIRMGGTCTGEHGIGLGKMKSLAVEHADSIATMAAIKRALDPDNIMNPGKIVAFDQIDNNYKFSTI